MGGAALGPPLSHAPTAPRDDGEPPQVPESRHRQPLLWDGSCVCCVCLTARGGPPQVLESMTTEVLGE